MIAVWASPGIARQAAVAVGSLTAHAVTTTKAADALAVVGGAAWCSDATAALQAGARAVLAVHPEGGTAADLHAVRAVADGRRVWVERRLRPARLAAQVRELLAAPRSALLPPSLIEIDVAAAGADLADALADAISWVGVVVHDPVVRLEGSAATRYGAIARLTALTGVGDAAASTTVVVTATAVRAGAGVLRATLLAPARVEVEIDLDARTQAVTVTDEQGAMTLAPSFDDPLRHALRRAIERLDSAEPTHDLDALVDDRAAATGIFRPTDYA
ncbi:hypothetical protein QSU92_10815 [Microbacterium sp. ET2]|uniref:hypothetical protein n=1 Tax=Microbacterium albipurpureum TaxID=3050384 RepID=UPI00259D086B|nr:hypothetical protein [Microbacterium sp. ET2 (Ac-2212)]WJL94469.1 hypothetical protein QSU92_10815 [Microbacterium sp. ET2 (Ac-2212)]